MDKSDSGFLDDVREVFRLSWITEKVTHLNLKLWNNKNWDRWSMQNCFLSWFGRQISLLNL